MRQTTKTSFRNKFVVAGVLAAGAFFTPRIVNAFGDRSSVSHNGILEEGIMTIVPVHEADVRISAEIRIRKPEPIAMSGYFLLVAAAFIFTSLVATKPLLKKDSPSSSPIHFGFPSDTQGIPKND